MFETIATVLGAVCMTALAVGICVFCARRGKKASRTAAQRKQTVEGEGNERVRRIENDPAFQNMMDECVDLLMEDLLRSEKNWEKFFALLFVHGWMIDVHHAGKGHEMAYQQYGMENIGDPEMLLAFMEASRIYLQRKIHAELADRGRDNCICSVTCKRKTKKQDTDSVHEPDWIAVECEFIHTFNKR